VVSILEKTNLQAKGKNVESQRVVPKIADISGIKVGQKRPTKGGG
jgi:hypothetical protein